MVFARPEHAVKFAERGIKVGNVPQGVAHRQEVKRCILKWNRFGSAGTHLNAQLRMSVTPHLATWIDSDHEACITDDRLGATGHEPRPDPDIDDSHPRLQASPRECSHTILPAGSE